VADVRAARFIQSSSGIILNEFELRERLSL